MEIDKIVSKICTVRKEDASKHMNEYSELSRVLREKGAEDPEFQRKFSSFYRLRRDDKFKKEYFEIIAKKECNLKQILTKLNNLNGKVEFSFATKAIHTINENAPMWDQNVDRTLGDEFGIECKTAIYEKLYEMQKQLLKNGQVRKKISDIRDSLEPERNSVSDEKILDFLLWEAGKPAESKEVL
jgi:hypothetical protein